MAPSTPVRIVGEDGQVIGGGNPLSIAAPVRAYTHDADTAATSGDNTLIAAPGAGNRIVVKDLVVQNETETETTVLLQSDDAVHWRGLLAAGASLSLGFASGEEWRLDANEPLVLNLSGANSHGYSVRYFVEAA